MKLLLLLACISLGLLTIPCLCNANVVKSPKAQEDTKVKNSKGPLVPKITKTKGSKAPANVKFSKSSKVSTEFVVENNIFIYSSTEFDANGINGDADARDILEKAFLKGLTATKAGKTPKRRNIRKLRNTIVSKVVVGVATDESNFISRVGLTMTATTTSDPSTLKDALQADLDAAATDGTLSTILSELDPTGKYGFSIISSVSNSAYALSITFRYYCEIGDNTSIEKEDTGNALKRWHKFVNEEDSQQVTDINVAVTNIESSDCVDDGSELRRLDNQQKHGRILRGSTISKVDYNFSGKCTGTCPSDIVPILEIVRRKLVDEYDDKVEYAEELIGFMSDETGVEVTEDGIRTDQDNNKQIAVLTQPSNSPSLSPSLSSPVYPVSSSPTEGSSASGIPSSSPTETSTSGMPSEVPSIVPSTSGMPSEVPSIVPSTSGMPSEVPSTSGMPSEVPSIVPSTSGMPSDI